MIGISLSRFEVFVSSAMTYSRPQSFSNFLSDFANHVTKSKKLRAALEHDASYDNKRGYFKLHNEIAQPIIIN